MHTENFAAFRQLSVRCDPPEKKPQLKKQLSVDDAHRRNLQIFLARDVVVEETAPADLVDRPVSAAAKRRGFQKRLNSAFNATVKEAPRRTLLRSTSAPCRAAEQRKASKFSRHKSRIKESEVVRKGDARGGSPIGCCEVETMVSLVSPAGSDCEDAGSGKGEKNDETLQKEEKFVTFQQSSIPSVRSFSASFPSRRTAENHRLLTRKIRSSSQDKYINLEKTRLNSVDVEKKPDETKASSDIIPSVEPTKASCIPAEQTRNEQDKMAKCDATENNLDNFESSKEKQCWNLYSKITKNGINVSFDTILRGMLTPTEYRVRQRTLPPMSSDANN